MSCAQVHRKCVRNKCTKPKGIQFTCVQLILVDMHPTKCIHLVFPVIVHPTEFVQVIYKLVSSSYHFVYHAKCMPTDEVACNNILSLPSSIPSFSWFGQLMPTINVYIAPNLCASAFDMSVVCIANGPRRSKTYSFSHQSYVMFVHADHRSQR